MMLGGDDVIVCISGVHTNPNTRTHRSVFNLSTLGPGFRKVSFRAPKTPIRLDGGPKRKALFVFTKKSVPCGQGLKHSSVV